MSDTATRFDEGKLDLQHIHPEVFFAMIENAVLATEFELFVETLDDWFYRKAEIDLLRGDLLNLACPVLTFGAKKYAALNYTKGMKYSRVLNSGRRHALAIARGEELDPESGLPHLGHLAANALFAYTYQVLGYDGGEFDDRPATIS